MSTVVVCVFADSANSLYCQFCALRSSWCIKNEIFIAFNYLYLKVILFQPSLE